MRLQKEPNELILDVRELSFTGFEASIQAPKDLRDLDDLFILALALGTGAIAIVSGDSDLLVMREFQGILIMTAKEFLDRFFPED